MGWEGFKERDDSKSRSRVCPIHPNSFPSLPCLFAIAVGMGIRVDEFIYQVLIPMLCIFGLIGLVFLWTRWDEFKRWWKKQ